MAANGTKRRITSCLVKVAFGAKRTCTVVWLRPAQSLMTHLGHSAIKFAVMHNGIPTAM
jgi:hypothetical protein